MTATPPVSQPTYAPWEAPAPILFNPWKHHAAALRYRLAEVGLGGDTALRTLPEQLVVMGTELMDLYTGILTPLAIGEGILAQLRANGRQEWQMYRSWLDAEGGYRTLTLAEDGSVWVLRAGPEAGCYVHVHPGRWTPHTRRVRANVLKTAVMVQAHIVVHGGDPLNVSLINQVRKQHLGLSPIKALAGDEGLRAILDLLRSTSLDSRTP